MKSASQSNRVTIAPREALDAIRRAQSLSRGESTAKSERGGAATLDPAKSARVSAREVLREEATRVRDGIAVAADDARSMTDRLEGIHRARRGLKRLHALRDLLRCGFERGEPAARTSIRRAKARLAETRHHDALALLLEELCALRGRPLTSDALHQRAAAHIELQADALREVFADVACAERSMRVVAGAPLDWHEITDAAARSWERARRCARQQWLGRTESWLHQTRKHFQRLCDQLAALALCTTESQVSTRKRLRLAAEQLGRARDLEMLCDMIDRATPEGRAVAKHALRLRARAVREARDLSRKALVATSAQMRHAMRARISAERSHG